MIGRAENGIVPTTVHVFFAASLLKNSQVEYVRVFGLCRYIHTLVRGTPTPRTCAPGQPATARRTSRNNGPLHGGGARSPLPSPPTYRQLKQTLHIPAPLPDLLHYSIILIVNSNQITAMMIAAAAKRHG